MKSLHKKLIITTIILVALIAVLCACKTNKCKDGHMWELTSTTATCYDDGVETYKCKKCKTTKTENVEAYGHDLVQSSYTAPTCKTNGEKVEKCTRCGFESKQTILVIDHDYQVKSTIPSSCTVKGSQLLECSMCHETKTESLELKDHAFELVNTIPSTCVVHGSKQYKCKDCTATKSEQLELAEHKYEIQTIEATCFTHGGTIKECSVCHDKKPLEETPLLTHNFGTDGYCTHCGIYETLFDENALNVTWSASTILGTVRGNLPTKFNESGKSILDSYWQDHIVELKISLLDENGDFINSASFTSSTLESGELIISHINYTQANRFSIYFGEYDIFTFDELSNCASFKIELSCDGYKSIEKTYQI